MAPIIDLNNIEKAKQYIKSAKEKPIIVKAQNLEFNRSLLEYGKFDILLSIEKIGGKYSLRYSDSGLNHVLARIAAKNKIAFGIDFFSLTQKNKKEKAFLLIKIKQNIKLCRKAGAKIKALNYKNEKNIFSLLLTLGASTQQAKDAL